MFSALSSMSGLVQIDADHNKLEIDMIGSLPFSITQLNFSTNQFSAIPPSFHTLINLTVLDLSCNRIETLEGVQFLINLVDLNLNDNLIVEIPEVVALLTKLKKMSLQRNRIGGMAVSFQGQSIHKDVFVVSNVDSLNLAGNSINKKQLMDFEGVEAFLNRRRQSKEKNLMLGASTDLELFGL
jgi:Leucine-rich repeat (LRR) protein